MHGSAYLPLAYVLHLDRRIPFRHAKNLLITAPADLSSYDELEGWWHAHVPSQPAPAHEVWNEATRQLVVHQEKGIHVFDLRSEGYPAWLASIEDPPPVLFVRGNAQAVSKSMGVAVVGTRDASRGGLEIARRIARVLGDHEWTVVSGLALGIDAAAHEGALQTTSPTIAVLAHGLEKASPRQNARLADQILEAGGAWVSEHALGVPARKENFVQRNRVQIGLSAGSIIVEAALRSGSMAQANFCVREKRKLFAVLPQTPDNPLGLNCSGTQDMVLRLEATPIHSKGDYPEMLRLLAEAGLKAASSTAA